MPCHEPAAGTYSQAIGDYERLLITFRSCWSRTVAADIVLVFAPHTQPRGWCNRQHRRRAARDDDHCTAGLAFARCSDEVQ